MLEEYIKIRYSAIFLIICLPFCKETWIHVCTSLWRRCGQICCSFYWSMMYIIFYIYIYIRLWFVRLWHFKKGTVWRELFDIFGQYVYKEICPVLFVLCSLLYLYHVKNKYVQLCVLNFCLFTVLFLFLILFLSRAYLNYNYQTLWFVCQSCQYQNFHLTTVFKLPSRPHTRENNKNHWTSHVDIIIFLLIFLSCFFLKGSKGILSGYDYH